MTMQTGSSGLGLSSRAERALPGLRLAYLALILYLLLNHGGGDPYSQNMAAIAVAAIALMAAPINVPAGPLRQLWLTGATLLLAFAGLALVQSIRFGLHPFEHEAWALARGQLGALSGAISVAPGQTRAALVTLAPLAGFLTILTLARKTEDAFLLLQRCAFLGGLVALYGLAQLLILPRSDDLNLPNAQAGSLTGFFINRNSAGTFLGMGMLVSMGLALFFASRLSFRAFALERFTRPSRDDRNWRQFGLFAGLVMIHGLALLLTQSRGALISTLIGFILLISLHVQAGARSADQPRLFEPFKTRGLAAKLALLFIGLAVILWMLGERTLYRFDAHGVDEARLCVFRSTWKAILDHWPFGAGFGVFADSFPPYRESQCAGVIGIWESAHNSYLEGMLGFGIGFTAFVLAAIAMLVRSYRIGLSQRRRYRFAPWIGLAVLTQLSLHALLDFSLHISVVGFYAAAILGASATISLEHRPAG